MPLGGLGAPKIWNLSSIQFVSLSTASIPNFSFLSPKIWILQPRGGFSSPRGFPWGAPEALRYGISPAYNSKVFQLLAYKISVSYLQKYGFYGLGVVLVSLGGAPGGPEAPKVWNLPDIHFVSLSIASIQNFSFLSPKI